MKVVVPGHHYLLDQLGTIRRTGLRFLRRSGKTIKHESEWPGLQTQEVLRALIDRTLYLNELIPCVETQDALYHLRMALYMYEVRAYRRKMDKVNRQDGDHDDSERPHPWRERDFEDVPFNEQDIEVRPVGPDGHIVV